MKTIYLILTALIITANVFGQAPKKMSYQAVIRDNSNSLVTNHAVGMQISILRDSSTGTSVYVETQTPTTDLNGLISIEVGGGTLVSGNFNSINWGVSSYYIKTETDPTGNTSYSITGTSQMLSVPYALYAKTSGNGGFAHYIGEIFGGGVIFHLWKDSLGIEHGLIVSLNNLTPSQEWSDVSNTLIGPSAQSSWNGLSNTNAIAGQAGSFLSAASICLNSTAKGQNDWYLPSITEVKLLFYNLFNVDKTLSSTSGANAFTIGAQYWSSNEYDASNAWSMDISTGDLSFGTKVNTIWVRAIRSF